MSDEPVNVTIGRGRLLAVLQWVALCAVGALSVISSPRQMLWEASQQPNIPVEFRGLSLSIPDFFLVALMLLSVLRFALDVDFRAQLAQTAQAVMLRLGGIWWVGLVFWMGIGTLWAGEGAFTRFGTLHALAGLVGAFLLADFVRRGWERGALLALFASAVVQSGIAVLQILNQGPLGLWALGEVDRFWYDTATFYRAPGLSMHPNYLGGYLVLAIFAAALVIRRGVGQRRALLVPLLIGVMSAIGLIATMSRSAILGMVVGLIPVAWVLVSALNRRARLVLGLLTLVVGIWGVLVLLPSAGERLFAPREFFFEDSFAIIQRAPVLGVGAGNLMLEIGRYRGVGDFVLLPVHNVWLFLWAELGLPGLALFSLGCLWVWRRVRPRRGTDTFIWGCCFVAISVIMLFDNYWWAVHPFRDLFFWALGLWWGYALRQEAAPGTAHSE